MRPLVIGAMLLSLLATGPGGLPVSAGQQSRSSSATSPPGADVDRLLAPIALYPDQ